MDAVKILAGTVVIFILVGLITWRKLVTVSYHDGLPDIDDTTIGVIMGLDDRKFYLDTLRSNECQCGKGKKPRYSLCWGCYHELPRELQIALYKPIGNGYEDAYDEAVIYLNTD